MNSTHTAQAVTAADLCALRVDPSIASVNYAVALNHAFGHLAKARELRRDAQQAQAEGLCTFAARYRLRSQQAFQDAREQLAVARFWRGWRNV